MLCLSALIFCFSLPGYAEKKNVDINSKEYQEKLAEAQKQLEELRKTRKDLIEANEELDKSLKELEIVLEAYEKKNK